MYILHTLCVDSVDNSSGNLNGFDSSVIEVEAFSGSGVLSSDMLVGLGSKSVELGTMVDDSEVVCPFDEI